MFTVFANLRIQSPDRLERLEACLSHLRRAAAQAWVFNIRGAFKEEAARIVRELAPCEVRVSHMESESGWFHDTLTLLEQVRSEFVVFAIEDHFLVANPLTLERTVQEMHELQIDHLEYSWFPRVQPRILLQGMSLFEGEFTVGADLDLQNNAQRHRNYEIHLGYRGSVYLVSLCSIMRTTLLRSVCQSHHPDRRRFNHMAPFDTERSGCDVDLLPIRIAHPKTELFAALDDDNIHPGSSLHQRGLYRTLAAREQVQRSEGDHDWHYRDQHFAVAPPLTRLQRCELHMRIYRQDPRLVEFEADFRQIAPAQLGAMGQAFAQVPLLAHLVDYGSLGGLASLYFLQAFRGASAHYRCTDDLEAVKAHENLFSNRIRAGFRVEYLEQRVSIGNPLPDARGLRCFADYLPFGLHAPAGSGPAHALLYADMTRLPAASLLDQLLSDLDDPAVKAVLSDSVVPPDHPWSREGAMLNQWLTERGFELTVANDYAVSAGTAAGGLQRRCALYRRAA
jgi:hypothetical protein